MTDRDKTNWVKRVIYVHPTDLEDEKKRQDIFWESQMNRPRKAKLQFDKEGHYYLEYDVTCDCGKCPRKRVKLKISEEIPIGYRRIITGDSPLFVEQKRPSDSEFDEVLSVIKEFKELLGE